MRAFYILDEEGKVLIFRHFKEIHDSIIIKRFYAELSDQIDEGRQNPIITIQDYNFAYIKHSNIYLVGICDETSNISAIFMFLYRVRDLFKVYFKELEEESVRDNFVVIYELIDEVIDFGIPQITEPSILQQYITQESYKVEAVKPPTAVTNAVSWRAEGIKHRKNQVFLDVCENIEISMSKDGTVTNGEIKGVVMANCQLSGMPDVRMGFNDRLAPERSRARKLGNNNSVSLEDIKFHQCVRLASFYSDRVISFIPPDGIYELMSYRMPFNGRSPFLLTHQYETFSSTRINCRVNLKSTFKFETVATEVKVTIPVPVDVDSPKLMSTFGVAEYSPAESAVVWNMINYRGGKTSELFVEMSLSSLSKGCEVKRPIQLNFTISYYAASRMHIQYFRVSEKSGYEASPWIKYMTYGSCQIRHN